MVAPAHGSASPQRGGARVSIRVSTSRPDALVGTERVHGCDAGNRPFHACNSGSPLIMPQIPGYRSPWRPPHFARIRTFSVSVIFWEHVDKRPRRARLSARTVITATRERAHQASRKGVWKVESQLTLSTGTSRPGPAYAQLWACGVSAPWGRMRIIGPAENRTACASNTARRGCARLCNSRSPYAHGLCWRSQPAVGRVSFCN